MVRSGVFGGDYLEDGSLLWHRREHNLGSEPVAGTYRGTPCTCGGHMVLVSGLAHIYARPGTGIHTGTPVPTRNTPPQFKES